MSPKSKSIDVQRIYGRIISHRARDLSSSLHIPHERHILAPHVLLVLITTPHPFHYRLRLLAANATLLSNDLAEHHVHLSCHICRVTTDIEVCLLLQKIVDKIRLLLQALLNVDLLPGGLTRKRKEQCKRVAKGLLVGLAKCQPND